MWTAKLTDIRKLDEAGLRHGFAIVYSNGVQKVNREYTTSTLDDDTIKRTARNEIAGFATVQQQKGELTLTEGSDVDLSEPAAPPPPDERTLFANSLRTYQQEQRAIALGFAVSATVGFADLEKLWEPGFIDLV